MLKFLQFQLAALLSLILIVGCTPPSSGGSGSASTGGARQAPSQSQPKSFEKVVAHLDYGGGFYYYMDFENSVEELAGQIDTMLKQSAATPNPLLEELPPILLQLNFVELVQALGLDNLDAYGASSYLVDKTWHNRSFTYLPGGRKGLLQLAGGSPAPFEMPALAPAGTDLLLETELNLKATTETVLKVAKLVGGAPVVGMLKGVMSQPMPTSPNGKTINDIVETESLRISALVRFDASKKFPIPVPDSELTLELPQAEFLVRVTALGWLLNEIPAMPGKAVDEASGLTFYPIGSLSPASPLPEALLAHNTTTQEMFIASSPAFLRECLSDSERLSSDKDYLAAMKDLPTEGNSLLYVSPESFSLYAQSRDQLIGQFPPAGLLFVFYGTFLPLLNVPDGAVGLGLNSANLADGILTVSNGPMNNQVSHANNSMATGAIVVGVMASILIPTIGNVLDSAKKTKAMSSLSQISRAYAQVSVLNPKPQPIQANTAEEFAYQLALKGLIDDPALYLCGSDEELQNTYGGNSIKELGPNKIHSSFVFVTNLPAQLKGSPTRIPVAWTRGLTEDGYWDYDSPWGGNGGHIAYADGHIETFDDDWMPEFVHYETGESTINVLEAIPPEATVAAPRDL